MWTPLVIYALATHTNAMREHAKDKMHATAITTPHLPTRTKHTHTHNLHKLRGGKLACNLPDTAAITDAAVVVKGLSGILGWIWPAESLEAYNVTAATEEQEVFFRLSAATYIYQAFVLAIGQERGLAEAIATGLTGSALLLLSTAEGREKLDADKGIAFGLSAILFALGRVARRDSFNGASCEGLWPVVGFLGLLGGLGAVAPNWLLENLGDVDVDKRVTKLGTSLLRTASVAKLATYFPLAPRPTRQGNRSADPRCVARRAAYFVATNFAKERAHALGTAALLGVEAIGCARFIALDADDVGVNKVGVGAWGVFHAVLSALSFANWAKNGFKDDDKEDSKSKK